MAQSAQGKDGSGPVDAVSPVSKASAPTNPQARDSILTWNPVASAVKWGPFRNEVTGAEPQASWRRNGE